MCHKNTFFNIIEINSYSIEDKILQTIVNNVKLFFTTFI